MTYLGALFERPHWQKTKIVLRTAALVLTLAAPVTVCAADAETLQKQGIQKVDQYLDHMRRTGDVNSLLPELFSAQAQLRYTKRGKYVDECTAIKEGDRAAYGKACGSDCRSGLNAAPASSLSTEDNTSPTSSRQAGNPDTRVWVNTNSGVYHCPGTRWYGKTKQGEFMSQEKAQEAGNRPAYGKVCQ